MKREGAGQVCSPVRRPVGRRASCTASCRAPCRSQGSPEMRAYSYDGRPCTPPLSFGTGEGHFFPCVKPRGSRCSTTSVDPALFGLHNVRILQRGQCLCSSPSLLFSSRGSYYYDNMPVLRADHGVEREVRLWYRTMRHHVEPSVDPHCLPCPSSGQPYAIPAQKVDPPL